MTPAARVQAAIEILDSVIEAARGQGAPADRVIAEWARNNRYAGSKDRRAIRELVYSAIRACGEVPANGRSAMLRLVQLGEVPAGLFDGSDYGPAAIAEGEHATEGGIAPEWLEDRLIDSDISENEAMALLSRAPLDLRINTLKVDAAKLDLPVPVTELPIANAVRLPAGTNVDQWEAYCEGLVEIQDAGSQVACMAVQAQPGETVIDLCAGGGGKTLSLAAQMDNRGTLIACDTDKRRLSQLAPRAERAGAEVSETVLLDPGREIEALAAWQGKADAVLVDAPCSGTGTWRRNPEARWRLTPQELARLTGLQQRLLGIAAQLVRRGGRIVYVTCSQLDEEGAGQVAQFLAANPGFSPQDLDLPLGRPRGAGMRLTPFHDGTDGFFIASLSSS